MSSKQIVKDFGCINLECDSIKDDETLIRLLCSPLFYNKETNIVNIDAFDLRMFKSGKLEKYVSLARPSCFESEDALSKYLSEKGYVIWDDKKNEENFYSAYGLFNCKEAREVHEMIEINPLIGTDITHIGLFYKNSDGGYYCGPLPKTDNPDILEVLSDLADLLEVKLAPSRKN